MAWCGRPSSHTSSCPSQYSLASSWEDLCWIWRDTMLFCKARDSFCSYWISLLPNCWPFYSPSFQIQFHCFPTWEVFTASTSLLQGCCHCPHHCVKTNCLNVCLWHNTLWGWSTVQFASVPILSTVSSTYYCSLNGLKEGRRKPKIVYLKIRSPGGVRI